MFSIDDDDFDFNDDDDDENFLANINLDDVSSKTEVTTKSRRSFQLESSLSPVNHCVLSTSSITESTNTALTSQVSHFITNTVCEDGGNKGIVIADRKDKSSVTTPTGQNQCSSKLTHMFLDGHLQEKSSTSCYGGKFSKSNKDIFEDNLHAGGAAMCIAANNAACLGSTNVTNTKALPNGLFETSLDEAELEFTLDNTDVTWMPAVVPERPTYIDNTNLIQHDTHHKQTTSSSDVNSVTHSRSADGKPSHNHVEESCSKIAQKCSSNPFSVQDVCTPQRQISHTIPASTPRKPSSMLGVLYSVAGQFDTPNTPQSSVVSARTTISSASIDTPSTGKRRRKFPGPAGILPELKDGVTFQDAKKLKPESLDTSPVEQVVVSAELTCSQISADHFQAGPWQVMKEELEMQATALLTRFSLSNIIRKASKKQLPKGKVPVTCVMIDSVNHQTPDASVLLRDPTGTMNGTIHRQLLKEHPLEFQPGSVLVLRQVGVFSPSPRNHYLNITPNNIVRIYTKISTNSSTVSRKLSAFVSSDFSCEQPAGNMSSPLAPVRHTAITSYHSNDTVPGVSNCHQHASATRMSSGGITTHKQYNPCREPRTVQASAIHRENMAEALRASKGTNNGTSKLALKAPAVTLHGRPLESKMCVHNAGDVSSQDDWHKDELDDLMSGIEDEMMTDF